ncbi:MAG: type IX secretion system protein PorQ [Bacteroidota bacterium]
MKNGLTILLLCLSTLGFAQIGGDAVYEFLDLPVSARANALGGQLTTVYDEDAGLGLGNPSLYNASMHQQAVFNFGLMPASINYGNFAYTHHVSKWNSTLAAQFQYIDYGTFPLTDETGMQIGTFKASEVAFGGGIGYRYNERFSFGANVRLVSSNFEAYNSFGMSTDIGASFIDTARNFTATVVLRNVGFQFSTFGEDNRENLPFNAQIGFSKRLRYLPLRLSVIFQHLQQWDIRFDDPNNTPTTSIFGEEAAEDSGFTKFVDNLFRHIVFSGELLLGKNDVFQIRFGYNHLRRQELSITNLRSLSGFSGGFGIRVKRFQIDYGFAAYHIAGGLNQFSLRTDIGSFGKNKRKSKSF